MPVPPVPSEAIVIAHLYSDIDSALPNTGWTFKHAEYVVSSFGVD